MTLAKAEKRALADLMRGQGFGGRRACQNLIRRGHVELGRLDGETLSWRAAEDPEETPEALGLWYRVNGVEVPHLDKVYVALHKPADVECSRSPSTYASIFDCLPGPFWTRDVQPVGRLDADTTGLLVLTDDGEFNHALTTPRRHLPKTYRIGLKHSLTPQQISELENGVVLRDDPKPTAPAIVKKLGDTEAEITITEGRYHQVKRMLAAVGNRVESIHRLSIGNIRLGDLPVGEWRVLTPEEVAGAGL